MYGLSGWWVSNQCYDGTDGNASPLLRRSHDYNAVKIHLNFPNKDYSKKHFLKRISVLIKLAKPVKVQAVSFFYNLLSNREVTVHFTYHISVPLYIACSCSVLKTFSYYN